MKVQPRSGAGISILAHMLIHPLSYPVPHFLSFIERRVQLAIGSFDHCTVAFDEDWFFQGSRIGRGLRSVTLIFSQGS
jgi:hypothetical protein